MHLESMQPSEQKSCQYLVEVETLAQDILTAKEEKLQIAEAKNKLREALRALEQSEDRKSWLQMGVVYVQRPTEECKKIINKELTKAELTYNELHNYIRDKSQEMRDLEYQPRLQGFCLKPMSAAEAKAIYKGFGIGLE